MFRTNPVKAVLVKSIDIGFSSFLKTGKCYLAVKAFEAGGKYYLELEGFGPNKPFLSKRFAPAMALDEQDYIENQIANCLNKPPKPKSDYPN